MIFIHSLCTESVEHLLNNLWAICGTAVDGNSPSRIVKNVTRLMQQPAAMGARFYRNLLLVEK